MASREPVNLQGPRFASMLTSFLSVSSLVKTAEMVADLGWVFLMALQWSWFRADLAPSAGFIHPF